MFEGNEKRLEIWWKSPLNTPSLLEGSEIFWEVFWQLTWVWAMFVNDPIVLFYKVIFISWPSPFPTTPPPPSSRTFKRPMNTPLSYVVHTLEVLAIHPPRTEERRRLLLPPLIPLLNTNPSASSCITKLKINHKAIKVKRSFESIVSALLSWFINRNKKNEGSAIGSLNWKTTCGSEQWLADRIL